MGQPLALRARWVFPVAAPPIEGGCVVIDSDRIAAVGRDAPGAQVTDLGDVALVPGLVNAHTHLEFAGLAAPLGTPGMSLPAWIRHVMQFRGTSQPSLNEAVKQGLAECLHSGTTTVGEIATGDWRGAVGRRVERLPHTVMFRELIGPTDERIGPAVDTAEAFLAAADAPDYVHSALSPHAPYTVHPALLDALVELARRRVVPLAMHLAESPEELELLHSGSGAFRELLVDLNAWNAAPDARLGSAMAYLEVLARAPRALVVHGNYLNAEERAFLAERAARMSLVYCPRTHAYFGHSRYPLRELLQSGANVALGTDSRASNPDLDMLGEMRCVAARHPDLAPARILELATLGGAKALGLAERLGTLEPGKYANLAMIAPGASGDDPHEQILGDDSRIVGTYLRGEPVGEPL